MKDLTLRAPAKINLTLDVIRRFENGYHELRMIMQTLDLYDTITLKPISEQEIRLVTEGNPIPGLTSPEDNIVYKAAALMRDTFQIAKGVQINLTKKIPAAAGLAGGSTDCAAVLVGMNTLFSCHATEEELRDLGVTLGADVPYCIMQGTALSEGIGNILTPLPAMPDCYILLIKPPIDVSTKYVYTHLQLDSDIKHPYTEQMISCIRRRDLEGMSVLLGNILESVTNTEYPIIEELKKYLLKKGAIGSSMSGSGPTVFGLFDTEAAAQAAYAACLQKYPSFTCHLTRPIERSYSTSI